MESRHSQRFGNDRPRSRTSKSRRNDDRPRRYHDSDRPRRYRDRDEGRPRRQASEKIDPAKSTLYPFSWDEKTNLALSCALGLTDYALKEVQKLGYKITAHDASSITIAGTMHDALFLNLHLRTAHRVLYPLGEFEAKNLDHLYNHAISIAWEEILTLESPFMVHGVVKNDTVRDSRMPSLKIKDAIADRLTEKLSARPNSGHDFSGAAIFYIWKERSLKIFLDTTGETLSKRGYRLLPGKAPMQEALTASVISAMEWDAKSPFIAPMCGSGTPAIEAALIARNRAPGLTRKHFAFMSIKGYQETEFLKLTNEAIAAETPLSKMPQIYATDISSQAIQISRANAKAAGVERFITFLVCDFADTPLSTTPSCIFMNPEYGERLGNVDELFPLYERIGKWYSQNPIHSSFILTSNPRLAKATKLTPNKMTPFYNGPLEVRLISYFGNTKTKTNEANNGI